MLRNSSVVRFLYIVLFVFSGLMGSAQDTKEDFLERMRMMNNEMTSIQSDFIQEKTLSIMEEVLVSTGQFYYKKPDLMKWDQQSPSPYYFILQGDKVIRFDGEKRKEISANNPQVAYFKEFILGTVTGSMFESDQFTSTFSRSGDELTIVLVPNQREMKKRIDKIQLLFSYEKMMLLDLIIMEKGGDKTVIHFTNQKFNSISDDTIFK